MQGSKQFCFNIMYKLFQKTTVHYFTKSISNNFKKSILERFCYKKKAFQLSTVASCFDDFINKHLHEQLLIAVMK